jgi:hypothetical protein
MRLPSYNPLSSRPFDTVLPLRVHALFGWGCPGLRAHLPCPSYPISGFPPSSAGANDRLGPKWISCRGFILCSPPLLLLTAWPGFIHGGIDQVILLCTPTGNHRARSPISIAIPSLGRDQFLLSRQRRRTGRKSMGLGEPTRKAMPC